MAFIDIDQTFEMNEENGVDKIYNAAAIKQSLKNLLLIRNGSYIKYRRPHYGSKLSSLLMKKINGVIIDQIRTEVELCIENYEPRVKLKSIETSLVENTLSVTINYFEINFGSEEKLEIKFSVLT